MALSKVTWTVVGSSVAALALVAAIGGPFWSGDDSSQPGVAVLQDATSSNGGIVSTALTAPVNSSLPTISGKLQSGQTIKANTGTWTDAVSYYFEWFRCPDSTGTNCLSVGLSSKFPLTQFDVGKYIQVMVVATNDMGSTTAYSLPRGPITTARR